MKKSIIMFTTPHTGTHTMHYLFNVLGGVRIHWCHLIPSQIPHIRGFLALPPAKDLVYLFTHRDDTGIKASWERRGSRMKGLPEAFETRDTFEPLVKTRGQHFTMPIEGTVKERAEIAINVMVACGATPLTNEFMNFIEQWPSLNTRDPNKEDFMTDERRKLVAASVHYRIEKYTPTEGEEDES